MSSALLTRVWTLCVVRCCKRDFINKNIILQVVKKIRKKKKNTQVRNFVFENRTAETPCALLRRGGGCPYVVVAWERAAGTETGRTALGGGVVCSRQRVSPIGRWVRPRAAVLPIPRTHGIAQT